jgi:hypothetical protein
MDPLDLTFRTFKVNVLHCMWKCCGLQYADEILVKEQGSLYWTGIVHAKGSQ